MFLGSQLLAFGLHRAIHWDETRFLARAQRVEAVMIDVTPDENGYRVQILYPANHQVNKTTVLMRNPPSARPGEKLVAFLDKENIWNVLIPEASPGVPLSFLQIACLGFGFCFYLFLALGAFATAELARGPILAIDYVRLHGEPEGKKSA